MATPAEVVETQFSNATSYAAAGIASMEGAISAFTDAANFENPTVDVTIAPVTPPTAQAEPTRPAALDSLDAEMVWDKDGQVAANMPTTLDVGDAPEIVVDDFDEAAPTIVTDDEPTLSYPDAPVLSLDTVPDVATPDDVAMPDEPTLDTVTAPTLLSLSTPTFAGVDLDEAFYTDLKNIPTLTLVAPTPYTHSVDETYTSALMTKMQSILSTRADGGTGLDPSVEAAIWNDARDREAAVLQANITEVARTSEQLGYDLPSDVLAGGVRKAQETYYVTVAGASRTTAIKQADLEQANLKDTITAGLELEGKLITHSLEIERLTFDNAKQVSDNAIAVHNARVEYFNALLKAYDTAAGVWRSKVDAEKAKIEVFRAEIAAEQAKADSNKTLIEQYKVQIDAGLSLVRIYEAQVGAAKTRVELEGLKVQASAERIRGFVAKFNAETAKVEVYKAQVSAEGMKVDAWGKTIEGRLGAVKVYTAKAQAFTAKANAQAEKSRALISRFLAQQQAATARWGAWEKIVEAERERLHAISTRADAVLAGFKAELLKFEAVSNQDSKYWETQIKEYEATKTYTMQGQKINADLFMARKEMNVNALKAAAQIYAQFTSSAISMIHVSAGVSASASNSVSYSYSNDTEDAAPTTVAV